MDDIFFKKLYDHSEEVPAHLWDAIEKSRSQRRRTSRFWGGYLQWMWAVLVVCSALAISQWMIHRKPQIELDSFPVPLELAAENHLPSPLRGPTFTKLLQPLPLL